MEKWFFKWLGIDTWTDLFESLFIFAIIASSLAPVVWVAMEHPVWVPPVVLFCGAGMMLGLKVSERWFKHWRRT